MKQFWNRICPHRDHQSQRTQPQSIPWAGHSKKPYDNKEKHTYIIRQLQLRQMPLNLQSSLKTLTLSRKQTQQGVLSLSTLGSCSHWGRLDSSSMCSEPFSEGQYCWLLRDYGISSWIFCYDGHF